MLALYYFLYKKIIKAIDHREKAIKNEFEEAEEKNRQAEELMHEYQEKNEQFNRQKEKMVKEAKEEALEVKEKQLEKIRKEIETKRKKWLDRIHEEKEKFLEEIKEKLADHFVTTSKKIIQDLAEERLQAQVINKLFSLLQNISTEEKKQILEKWRERKEKTLSLSLSHEISQEELERIRESLVSFFGEEIEMDYREDTHLLLGITIKFDGYKIEWSAREYLDQILQEMKEMVKASE